MLFDTFSSTTNVIINFCKIVSFKLKSTNVKDCFQDEWICIGWANLNVFNHNSCLIQGRQKVRFWPTETNNSKIIASMYGFNERALAGLYYSNNKTHM
jgi:hypothetical protein